MGGSTGVGLAHCVRSPDIQTFIILFHPQYQLPESWNFTIISSQQKSITNSPQQTRSSKRGWSCLLRRHPNTICYVMIYVMMFYNINQNPQAFLSLCRKGRRSRWTTTQLQQARMWRRKRNVKGEWRSWTKRMWRCLWRRGSAWLPSVAEPMHDKKFLCGLFNLWNAPFRKQINIYVRKMVTWLWSEPLFLPMIERSTYFLCSMNKIQRSKEFERTKYRLDFLKKTRIP